MGLLVSCVGSRRVWGSFGVNKRGLGWGLVFTFLYISCTWVEGGAVVPGETESYGWWVLVNGTVWQCWGDP